jgi:hypothetical protein
MIVPSCSADSLTTTGTEVGGCSSAVSPHSSRLLLLSLLWFRQHGAEQRRHDTYMLRALLSSASQLPYQQQQQKQKHGLCQRVYMHGVMQRDAGG